jgi:hypothetical protein
VIGVSEPENVAHVLDDYVLETASSAKQGNAPIPGEADHSKGSVHVPVGTRWANKEPREAAELSFHVRLDLVGGNPLNRKGVGNVSEGCIGGLMCCFCWVVVPDYRNLGHRAPPAFIRFR